MIYRLGGTFVRSHGSRERSRTTLSRLRCLTPQSVSIYFTCIVCGVETLVVYVCKKLPPLPMLSLRGIYGVFLLFFLSREREGKVIHSLDDSFENPLPLLDVIYVFDDDGAINVCITRAQHRNQLAIPLISRRYREYLNIALIIELI